MNLYKRYTQVGPPFVPPICRHLKVPSRWGLVTDYLNVPFLPNFGILCKYLVKTKNKLLSYFCFDLRQCLSREETFSNHQTPSRRTMAYTVLCERKEPRYYVKSENQLLRCENLGLKNGLYLI